MRHNTPAKQRHAERRELDRSAQRRKARAERWQTQREQRK